MLRLSGQLKHDLCQSKETGDCYCAGKELVEKKQCDLASLAMDIIFDDHLQTQRHVYGCGHDKEAEQDRVNRHLQECKRVLSFCANQGNTAVHEPEGERHQSNCRDSLTPEVLCSGV